MCCEILGILSSYQGLLKPALATDIVAALLEELVIGKDRSARDS